MIARLLDRLERRAAFVVGKGGVGKTTTAGGIALALADRGESVRLVSTDPAHSLADLFRVPGPGPAPSPCTARLVLEEVDAEAVARTHLNELRPSLRELVDRGTYLDEQDADSLLDGALPGLDEIGAALRLAELARGAERLVVDTAPTGHTLRLLDVPRILERWIGVFTAMAEKADTVASALVRQPVRLGGEDALDDLRDRAERFDALVRDADFVVVTAAGEVVRAETRRLRSALERRGLRVAAVVGAERPGLEADVRLPFRAGLEGCEALREWIAGGGAPAPAVPQSASASVRGSAAGEVGEGGAAELLEELLARELVVFAGKGGVGKTTAAAAAAVRLADAGPVRLVGADPAGSLSDVLPDPPPPLEVRELDADRELERFRGLYREEVESAFRAAGLDAAARLDREVVESLWGLAPPGLDEIVAVARLAADDDAASPRVVLDTAPTGHFLRLVAMPELARDWVHRIMRLLIKYRAAGGLDAPAEALVRFARRLRDLQERLADPSRTAIILVTLEEPLVRAETRRLAERLRERGLAPAAVLVNQRAGRVTDYGVRTLRASAVEPPVGAARLRRFFDGWEPAR